MNVRAQRRGAARTAWLFLLPFVLLFVISFVIPIIASVYNSLFQVQRSGTGLGPTVQTFVGLDNYLWVLGSGTFWTGMGRVLIFGLFQIPIMIFGALGLALLLDSLSARFVKFYRVTYFLPYAIPGVIAAIVWTYLYSPNLSPLIDGLRAIGLDVNLLHPDIVLLSMANITTWVFTGYNMLIFLSALQTIPHELYDAARMDGATEWAIVRKIKFPMVRSAMLLTVLLSIIGTIQLFNEPVIMQRAAPFIDSQFTPLMMAYHQAFGLNNLANAGAISVVMAAVAGVLAFIYSKLQRKAD